MQKLDRAIGRFVSESKLFDGFKFGEGDYWTDLKERIRHLQDKIITNYQSSPQQKPAVDTSIFYAQQSSSITGIYQSTSLTEGYE